MAEYGSMFLVSGLASILFFGGWNGPIPLFSILSWTDSSYPALVYLAHLGGCVNFMFKATVGVTVMIWVRWTLPRLRIDQVITTCLKYCVPVAAVCFLGALVWQVAELPSPNDWHLLTSHRAEIRETWVEAAAEVAAEDVHVSDDAEHAPADEHAHFEDRRLHPVSGSSVGATFPERRLIDEPGTRPEKGSAG